MIKVIASGMIALFGALCATASLAAEADPAVMLIPSGESVTHLEMDLTAPLSLDALVIALAPVAPDVALPPVSKALARETSPSSASWHVTALNAPPGQQVSSNPGQHIPLRI
ncbi:MAG: hypothetical protein EpisKO_41530 [Epibacterium sp.]